MKGKIIVQPKVEMWRNNPTYPKGVLKLAIKSANLKTVLLDKDKENIII